MFVSSPLATCHVHIIVNNRCFARYHMVPALNASDQFDHILHGF